jgi:GntR family transcriptional regulator, transcriptional repressor for pyruvate dehydrogenase complex
MSRLPTEGSQLLPPNSPEIGAPEPEPLRVAGLRTVKRSSSVALDAVEQIKQMIINGELRAGEKLPTERELADTLGVSRPTVRESIRALEALRIVEPMQGAGTYVTSLEPELLAEPIDFLLQVNEDALLDLFDARVVLESGLARMAGTRRTDEDIHLLEQTIAQHSANLGDADLALEFDLRFHTQVAHAAHSPILASLLASTSALGRASRARTGRSLGVREQAHRDHESVLIALRDQDPTGAERAMLSHLENVRRAIQ